MPNFNSFSLIQDDMVFSCNFVGKAKLRGDLRPMNSLSLSRGNEPDLLQSNAVMGLCYPVRGALSDAMW